MDILLGFAAVCLTLAAFLVFSFRFPYPLNVVSLLLAFFGSGYYVVPLLMPKESGWKEIPEDLKGAVLSLHFGYLVMFLCGMMVFSWIDGKKKIGRFSEDTFSKWFLFRLIHQNSLWFLGCALVLLAYFSVNGVGTSYESDDRYEYFTAGRGPIERLSVIVPFVQGFVCYMIAGLFSQKKWRKFSIVLAVYVLISLISSFKGQRLAAIIPFVMLFVFSVRQIGLKKALPGLVAIGVFLVIISPVAVFFRESWANQDEKSVRDQLVVYLEDGPSDEGVFTTIGERADLYYVTYLFLSEEELEFDRIRYVSSVLFAFLPREFRPNPHYPLSDDGSIYGETSVVAWFIERRNYSQVGSLTAFGGLYAFREGGWFWVPVNGFLCGAFGSFLCTCFARWGLMGSFFLGVFTLSFVVKYVPSSLFQLLVSLSQYMNVIFAIVLFECFLRCVSFRKS
ncbi:hypothetical protein AAFN60_00020 [Roseibacillus persicicus]|uniref:hypothetical protein n=1 Tax=Roseibacillus persicicus TaxID=454148 RepID=UPI00398A6E2B